MFGYKGTIMSANFKANVGKAENVQNWLPKVTSFSQFVCANIRMYAGFKSHGFTITRNKLHVHISEEVLSGTYPSFDDKKHSERILSPMHFVTDNVIHDEIRSLF